MALDEDLNERLRSALKNRSGLSEKKMMGGMCFLLNGHMIGGADRSKDGVGRFMFRIGKENHEMGLGLPGAQPMIQGGRTLSGLFFVAEDDCSEPVMVQWLKIAVAHALTLKPK